MRRPVKPFVTEYRGAGRRQSATGTPAPKPDFSNIDQEQPPAEPRQPAPRSLAEPSEDGYEAALRAADALFSAKPERAAASPDGETSSDAGSAAASSHPSGGRILRVLDEPPSPEMLRLEAERAPKRRGRKPGSKNKPKPVAPASAPLAAPPLEESAAAPPNGLAMPLTLAAIPMGAARPAGATGDKYAWVRTKLKPGQQWKRRLPKVAW